MAILPTNLLGNLINRSDTAATSSNTQAAALAVSEANRQAVLDLVQSLSPGDTLVGTLLYADKENLSLQTKEGLVLNAKNGSEIALEKGESIAFTVERTNKKTVTLRPLYQNTAKDQTTVIALKQAGIPINGRSVEMTARNMEYGRPIDRDSLSASYKDVSLYPEAPVKDIVDLQRMGIEVNESNLRQYANYVNAENSISRALDDIALSLSDSVSDELLNILPDKMVPFTVVEAEDGSQVIVQNEYMVGDEGVIDSNQNAQQNLLSKEDIKNMVDKTTLDAMIKFSDSLQTMESPEELLVSKGEIEILKDTMHASALTTNNLNSIVLNENESITPSALVNSLFDDIKANITDILTFSNSGKIDNNQLIEALNTKIDGMENILKSNLIPSLVNRAIASQWSLNRDKIGDKAEVKDLYERMFSQTRELTQLIMSTNPANENVTAPVTNLMENVDFMNALNQFIPYVQIPFNNGEDNNASELYVFSNKKKMSESGGEITAFIHLDMPNIGPTDVYVKLTSGDNVTTKFTVKDDEVLTLIEEHLDFLSKRLNEKGYSFKAEMTKSNEIKSSLENALDNTTQRLLIANTSFDARV